MDRLALVAGAVRIGLSRSALDGWSGFGLAVQTYQKRVPALVRWLVDLARDVGRTIEVRWSRAPTGTPRSNTPRSRVCDDYPVFTRKANTDVCYLACATGAAGGAAADLSASSPPTTRRPWPASCTWPATREGFEFQRLHGMGEELYAEVIGEDKMGLPCRVYAPVGNHEDLLPYLVRRLLENGPTRRSSTASWTRRADRRDRRRPGRHGPDARSDPSSAYPAAGGYLRRRAQELTRHNLHGSAATGRPGPRCMRAGR